MSHRFTISLPDDAYSLLEEDAKRNCRTLSEELTYMLRTHKGKYSAPIAHEPFIKPTLDENPRQTITAQYKRKEIL